MFILIWWLPANLVTVFNLYKLWKTKSIQNISITGKGSTLCDMIKFISESLLSPPLSRIFLINFPAILLIMVNGWWHRCVWFVLTDRRNNSGLTGWLVAVMQLISFFRIIKFYTFSSVLNLLTILFEVFFIVGFLFFVSREIISVWTNYQI